MNVDFFMIFQNKRGIFYALSLIRGHLSPCKLSNTIRQTQVFSFRQKKVRLFFPFSNMICALLHNISHNCSWKETGFCVTIELSNR